VLTRAGVCVECKHDDAGSLIAPPDQLIGRNLRDFPLGPGVNQLLQNNLERTLVSGRMETFIYEQPSTNGHYEARMSALNDEEVLCIIRDITDQRSAEIELNKRLDVLAALQQVDAEVTQTLNIDYVLAVALDATLRLSNANAGFIALIEGEQIQVAQAIGRYPLEPGKTDPLRLREGIVGRVVRTRRAALIHDVFEDNDYIPVLPTTRAQMVIPLISHDMLVGVLNLETNQQGRFNNELFNFVELMTARIAVAIDNARLYQVSQTQLAQLKDLYGQVSELEQLKTQMIRIAAHDLRSPLGVVSGYISLLEEELGNDLIDQHRAYFGPIHRAINRMQRMTTDVLSLERIHAAQARDWQDMSLRDLVERAVLDQRDQSTAAGLEMRVEMPEEDITLRADPVQLYEAVTNLINNAIKYTPKGGTVTVRLFENGEHATFDVRDTGMGVPEEFRAGLFRPFYRVKTQETKDIDGTGLGLYLVKGIVERHNGAMLFETEHGKGSLFGFELPLTGSTTESVEETSA
jgi:signal transduction histidine kinase